MSHRAHTLPQKGQSYLCLRLVVLILPVGARFVVGRIAQHGRVQQRQVGHNGRNGVIADLTVIRYATRRLTGGSEADPFGETRMKPGWLSSRRRRPSWRRAMRLSRPLVFFPSVSLSLSLSHSRSLVLSQHFAIAISLIHFIFRPK